MSTRELLFSLLFCCISAAEAHVGLAVTVPDHDVVLDEPPAQLHFQFMTQMTLINIRLETQDGARIDVRIPRNSVGQSTLFGEQVALDLPPLAPATYKVTWQAMSIDGHTLLDDFSFTVAVAGSAD